MEEKAQNLKSEIRRQKQVRGKWEIDQKMMSPGYIQGIFAKILRNIHDVHNMRPCWSYKLESQRKKYKFCTFDFTYSAYSNSIIFTPISSLEIQQESSIPSLGFV